MSRANILDTGTTSYLELIGNGKAYRVPPYQRDYAWTQEEWDDLWNDVVELRGEPDGRHYMGALVVQAHGDREFLVIDGQQRLATISVLALAVIARLRRMADLDTDRERNLERATELRNRFVGEKDPASLVESSRLRLNETDDPFYQDYLVQLRAPLNPRGLPRSNWLLWKCFRYAVDKGAGPVVDEPREGRGRRRQSSARRRRAGAAAPSPRPPPRSAPPGGSAGRADVQGHRSPRLKVTASKGRICTGSSSFAVAISTHCPSRSSNASSVRSAGSTIHMCPTPSRA